VGNFQGAAREATLSAKYTAVSLVGFAADGLLLLAGTSLGLEVAWARLISLAAAMQLTFLINALFVFRSHDRSRWARQWIRYMLSNGAGNFCNYWIFVTLVSTHWRLVSDRLFALAVGATCAWIINFSCTRLLVFSRKPSRRAAPGAAGVGD